MHDLFATFRDQPTRETFLAVRQAVVAHSDYDPYARDLDEALALFGEKKYREAQERIKAAMPNLLLSPKAHLVASVAARELGDSETQLFENKCCFRCLEGILSTGDGSEARPYLVLRTSDIYDVLMLQQKKLATQALVQKGGRSYDQMTCTDGTVLWFDVTDAYNKLSQMMGGDWLPGEE